MTNPDPLPESIKFMRVPLHDDTSEDITPYLPSIFRFIRVAVKEGGKILIHCYAGISRAPAIALAYGIKYLGWKTEEALR
jgi:dual specificity phosphatase 12